MQNKNDRPSGLSIDRRTNNRHTNELDQPEERRGASPLERVLERATHNRGVLATLVTQTIGAEHGLGPRRLWDPKREGTGIEMLSPHGQVELLQALDQLYGLNLDFAQLPDPPELLEGNGAIVLVPRFGTTGETARRLVEILGERSVPGLDTSIPRAFFASVVNEESPDEPSLGWHFVAFSEKGGAFRTESTREFGIPKDAFTPAGNEILAAMLYHPHFLRSVAERMRQNGTLFLPGIRATLRQEDLNEILAPFLTKGLDPDAPVTCILQVGQGAEKMPSALVQSELEIRQIMAIVSCLEAWTFSLK